MGNRGPAAKPTALKMLQGNPGKGRINHEEPRPKVLENGAPAPAWLSGEAREIWDQYLPMMVRLKLLTEADRDSFARYCDTFARWLRVKQVLDDNSEGVYTLMDFERDHFGRPVVDEKTGEYKKRVKKILALPQVKIYHALLEKMQAYEKQFGLTPSSRSSITIGGGYEKAEDPVAAYLFGVPGGKD